VSVDLPQQAMEAVAALAGIQELIARCPTAEDRKGLIMAALCHGAIECEQCELLIQAWGLETA
jgi:hypothetical protein